MLNDDQKDVFVEIFNTGIGRASDSLSRLLNSAVELQKPIVRFLNPADMETYNRQQNVEGYVAVAQEISGFVEGVGIVSFPVTDGKTLIDVLLENTLPPSKEFSDIEVEAITEVGNMIVNGVASAIADMSSLSLVYQVPRTYFSRTMVPENQHGESDLFCVAETQFSVKDLNISGFINLVFSIQHAQKIAETVLRSSQI